MPLNGSGAALRQTAGRIGIFRGHACATGHPSCFGAAGHGAVLVRPILPCTLQMNPKRNYVAIILALLPRQNPAREWWHGSIVLAKSGQEFDPSV